MNKQAERLRQEYGRTPYVYDVEQAMMDNLKELVDLDYKKATKFNSCYLSMARGMFDTLCMSKPEAMIFGCAEIIAYRYALMLSITIIMYNPVCSAIENCRLTLRYMHVNNLGFDRY